MTDPPQPRMPPSEFQVAWFCWILWFLSVIGFTLLALEAKVLSPYWGGRIMAASFLGPLVLSWIAFRFLGRRDSVASLAFCAGLASVCLGNLTSLLAAKDTPTNFTPRSVSKVGSLVDHGPNGFKAKLQRLGDASDRLDHEDFLNLAQIQENGDYAWQLDVANGFSTANEECLAALKRRRPSLQPSEVQWYSDHETALLENREVAERVQELLVLLKAHHGDWSVDAQGQINSKDAELQQQARMSLDELKEEAGKHSQTSTITADDQDLVITADENSAIRRTR